jgi:hypothetical protein
MPFKSLENVTLKTSWEKALVRKTTNSLRQSQMVNMKSGADPSDAKRFPVGLFSFYFQISLDNLSPQDK